MGPSFSKSIKIAMFFIHSRNFFSLLVNFASIAPESDLKNDVHHILGCGLVMTANKGIHIIFFNLGLHHDGLVP